MGKSTMQAPLAAAKTAARKRKLAPHYGWAIALVGTLCTIGGIGFGRFGYTVILPSMREGLSLSYTEAGLLNSGNFIGYLIFTIIGGFLVIKLSPRIVISSFLAIAGLGIFMTGLANGFYLALAMRAVAGLGTGGANVPMVSLASAWFTTKRRGLATGLMVAGCGLAITFAGTIVPKIIETHGTVGWRYSWFYLGLLTMGFALICAVFIRNSPKEVGLLPVGATDPPAAATDPSGQKKLAFGRTSTIFKSQTVWHLSITYFMFGFSYIIYTTFFSVYLIQERGLTQVEAGRLWAMFGAISIISSLFWGSVSDRTGRKYGLVMVFVINSAAFALFAAQGQYLPYYLSAILFGLSAWGTPTIIGAAAGDYLGARLASPALATMTVFHGLGQLLAPPFAGYIADLYGTFKYGFILATFISILGAISSSMLRKPKEPS